MKVVSTADSASEWGSGEGGACALHKGDESAVLMELCGINAGQFYFTIILQSSVGTLEPHSQVGVYLASFCVPN